MTTNPERDACPLLIETELDMVQVATITGLPAALVAGVADGLDGGTGDGWHTITTAEEAAEYERGRRLADEWLWVRFTGEQS